jgi:hypothetical protein
MDEDLPIDIHYNKLLGTFWLKLYVDADLDVVGVGRIDVCHGESECTVAELAVHSL